jgi:Na+/H+-dicarboxylate symporter
MIMNAEKLYALALNPWVIFSSLGLGFLMGVYAPEASLSISYIGDIYVDLLKMIALPFMVSAVIFSLQRLFREGGSATLLKRVGVVFVAFFVATAILGAITMLIFKPGADLSAEEMQTFGQIVGSDLSSSDTVMALNGVDEPEKKVSFVQVLVSMVPSNIFSALATGDALKTLVFAMLFGFAVGRVPSRVSDGLTQTLETIYNACQVLMRWLNYPLPIILFCMSAAQMAKTGVGPLQAMAQFVLAFAVASLLVLAIAAVIIWKRSNATFTETLSALEAPFALALATRSSPTCMPSMIESLADKLGFARTRVELVVPLGISLLRIGPVVYYVAATIFIAQLYGKTLGPSEIAVVLSASILAGFASAGMTGLLTVSLIGLTCSYLGLPFEAAFILFVAVDPICDMLRTLVNVIGNSAAVALISPRPLKL